MMQYCKKCVMPSTRPRVIFDESGVCNACNNWEIIKKINWDKREVKLREICDKYRSKDGSFDVIVPVGGGKDSSYVAWKLKHEYNMHPLCVSVKPPLQTRIGEINLKNFVESGFHLVEVSPNPEISRKIAKNAFIKDGQPQLDWLFAIKCVPIKIAVQLRIPLIFYGEEAESLYGGSNELKDKFNHGIDHVKNLYLSGLNIKDYLDKEANESDLYWFMLPSKEEADKIGLFITHWSNFEYWDEDLHFKLATEKCGLKFADKNTPGAYNNKSHIDQSIYYLHMYLAYLKFGFARATTDACIDIRNGKISKEEAIKLVKEYDHKFPYEYLNDYLEYFEMSEDEFWETLEKFRNKEIWEKVNGEWKLKIELK